MSRYANETPFTNNSEFYKEFFKERGVRYIRQFRTGKLRHPTIREMASLERINHVWSLGDRYYKLAHKYYGDSSLWWIIASSNNLGKGTLVVPENTILRIPAKAAIQDLVANKNKER